VSTTERLEGFSTVQYHRVTLHHFAWIILVLLYPLTPCSPCSRCFSADVSGYGARWRLCFDGMCESYDQRKLDLLWVVVLHVVNCTPTLCLFWAVGPF
jgi:hypothetical protein